MYVCLEQVELESYTGSAINYELLEGKWKLVFTTANDVVSESDVQKLCLFSSVKLP